jgi:altronate dehydratase
MSFNEDVDRLRHRLSDLLAMGLLDDASKGTYELTLLQVMNESERQRQTCIKRADSLKMQAATAEGQAAAFSMISSIVNNVVNSLVRKSEKATEEEEMLAAEKLEREVAKAKEVKSKKTTSRKKRTSKASKVSK